MRSTSPTASRRSQSGRFGSEDPVTPWAAAAPAAAAVPRSRPAAPSALGARSASAYAVQELRTWGFPVEGRFRRWLRLWKSLGRAPPQPLPKRLVQARRRPWVAARRQGFGRMRNRDVGVELPVPHEDVQALDLLDQQHDRPARRCDLGSRVVLEPAAPSTQDLELLGVKSTIGHAARLSPKRVRCRRGAASAHPGDEASPTRAPGIVARTKGWTVRAERPARRDRIRGSCGASGQTTPSSGAPPPRRNPTGLTHMPVRAEAARHRRVASTAVAHDRVSATLPPPRARRRACRCGSARARTARSARASCRWRRAPRASSRRSGPP